MPTSHCALLAEYDSRLTADHFLLTNRERDMKALNKRIKTAEGASMSEARSGEYSSLCEKRRKLGREIGVLEAKIKKVTAEMKGAKQKAKRARVATQAKEVGEGVKGGVLGKVVGKLKVWLT